ncbi:unnamed protein product [Symbiodinium natans]|uniref:Ubiquitin-like domain-containing protein n=1 Tax=Symbiodinium natans TaxID=878477 RepID=A0A812L9Q1_9DINO|nr:unnamed protein product [Symbiodinium natans]
MAAGTSGERLRLSLCNMLTGELLREVELAPSDSLQAVAAQNLPEWLPMRLLYNTEPCGHDSALSLGIVDGAVVHVVRLERHGSRAGGFEPTSSQVL